MERTRLTLDLSPKLDARLQEMATSRGISKSDVFRLGIELLKTSREAQEEGFTVGAWKQDGNILREQVFIV